MNVSIESCTWYSIAGLCCGASVPAGDLTHLGRDDYSMVHIAHGQIIFVRQMARPFFEQHSSLSGQNFVFVCHCLVTCVCRLVVLSLH